MSWYQAMAGADIRVAAASARRIGLNGIGIDDRGVVENVDGIVPLLNLGADLKAVNATDFEPLAAIEHGTVNESAAISALCERSLTALSARIEAAVPDWVGALSAVPQATLAEYRTWAAQSGWEYGVEFTEADTFMASREGLGLRLCEQSGLTLMICETSKLDGPHGEALHALAGLLSAEALKGSSLEVMQWHMEMRGAPVRALSEEEAGQVEGLSGKALVTWYTERMGESLCEILEYFESPEDAQFEFLRMRDIGVAVSNNQAMHRRLFGEDDDLGAKLTAIEAVLQDAPESELVRYAIRCCETLKGGAATDDLLVPFRALAGFEYAPGGVTLVDDGRVIAESEAFYEGIHDMAMNGDDVAVIPLGGDTDQIIGLLTRITMAERMVLGLSALIQHHLSPE